MNPEVRERCASVFSDNKTLFASLEEGWRVLKAPQANGADPHAKLNAIKQATLDVANFIKAARNDKPDVPKDEELW